MQVEADLVYPLTPISYLLHLDCSLIDFMLHDCNFIIIFCGFRFECLNCTLLSSTMIFIGICLQVVIRVVLFLWLEIGLFLSWIIRIFLLFVTLIIVIGMIFLSFCIGVLFIDSFIFILVSYYLIIFVYHFRSLYFFHIILTN